MGREPRPVGPDLIYHVMSRGNARILIFHAADDRLRFLDLLQRVTRRYDWACLAYCLMSNHFHLLVRTPHPNLPAGMRDLNGRYARAFNDAHGREDHLFRNRYKAIVVTGDAQLLSTLRYIARNPVAAGLAPRPEQWPWSSYAALARPGAAPNGIVAEREVLEILDPEPHAARQALVAIVAAPEPYVAADGRQNSPW